MCFHSWKRHKPCDKASHGERLTPQPTFRFNKTVCLQLIFLGSWLQIYWYEAFLFEFSDERLRNTLVDKVLWNLEHPSSDPQHQHQKQVWPRSPVILTVDSRQKNSMHSQNSMSVPSVRSRYRKSLPQKQKGGRELVHLIKVLAMQTWGPSLEPQLGEENWVPKVALWPLHTMADMHLYVCTY